MESYDEPQWAAPSTDKKFRTGLFMNNSLSRGSKVEFVPQEEGRKVTWYGCGPTVYDAAHMGHARTYVAFDIIRRIMTSYFHYEVFMCMNITDIDDKIILRSNEKNIDFAVLARYWEAMFWKDMRSLNVLPPDVITRVSEYIPQVIEFIVGIINNGYAYESQGSVYFDIQNFRSSPQHFYGRMEPFSINDQERVLEGEGALGIVTDKKCCLDFALWKKAKEGEPSWDSPWGSGRPGWHIECSAMASSIFGFPIDIHSGGIDLRFPHHDNELAQSEAKYNKPQWVNYFLHSGHLHIKGSKMSKSLKNFITISECIESFSSRAVRILALMQRWDSPMNYSPDGESMIRATEWDKIFTNFFGVIQAFNRDATNIDRLTNVLKDAPSLKELTLGGLLGNQNWDEVDLTLHSKIQDAQKTVDAALKDNFDTPAAMLALRNLISEIHVYLKREGGQPKSPLIMKGARFIFSMLKIFGLTNGDESELNFVGGINEESSIESDLMDSISKFRFDVRQNSQILLKDMKLSQKASNEISKSMFDNVNSMLKLCDVLRDQSLVDLGIQLEDTATGAVWKKSTRDELVRERDRKLVEEKYNNDQKQEALRLQLQAKTEKELKLQTPSHLYYQTYQSDIYKEFDENGVPIITTDGSPVSKAQKTKMKKFLEKHAALHRKWLEDNKA